MGQHLQQFLQMTFVPPIRFSLCLPVLQRILLHQILQIKITNHVIIGYINLDGKQPALQPPQPHRNSPQQMQHLLSFANVRPLHRFQTYHEQPAISLHLPQQSRHRMLGERCTDYHPNICRAHSIGRLIQRVIPVQSYCSHFKVPLKVSNDAMSLIPFIRRNACAY